MMTPSTPFTPMAPFAPYVLPSLVSLRSVPSLTSPSQTSPSQTSPSRLVAELAPRIRAVTRAILGRGHPEVEDAYQQGMLEFIRALPSFRGDCEPIYFASRIAARTALNIARRSRAAHARCEDGADVDQVPVEVDPDMELEQNRRMALLRDLLARIPEEQAETLTMRVVLGWSLPEVAAATGAPLNTVRSRIRLAKNALRAAVELRSGHATGADGK